MAKDNPENCQSRQRQCAGRKPGNQSGQTEKKLGSFSFCVFGRNLGEPESSDATRPTKSERRPFNSIAAAVATHFLRTFLVGLYLPEGTEKEQTEREGASDPQTLRDVYKSQWMCMICARA